MFLFTLEQSTDLPGSLCPTVTTLIVTSGATEANICARNEITILLIVTTGVKIRENKTRTQYFQPRHQLNIKIHTPKHIFWG